MVLLCAILHPQRTLGPSKVQEDIDRIEGDEEAAIGETMAAEQEACLAEASALTWDEDLINMFRLEYARQYIAAHPDAKLAVVAEESGFASGSSFSKAKRSVPEIVPEYVEGVHIA